MGVGGDGGKMVGRNVRVTTFALSGKDARILLSVQDAGEITLEYDDLQGTRHFSGRQIDRVETMVGLLLSVQLEYAPDQHQITLSLVVPDTMRPENAKSVKVDTFAVRTTHRTSLAGPEAVDGQRQLYESYALEGNAW